MLEYTSPLVAAEDDGTTWLFACRSKYVADCGGGESMWPIGGKGEEAVAELERDARVQGMIHFYRVRLYTGQTARMSKELAAIRGMTLDALSDEYVWGKYVACGIGRELTRLAASTPSAGESDWRNTCLSDGGVGDSPLTSDEVTVGADGRARCNYCGVACESKRAGTNRSGGPRVRFTHP